MLIPKIPQSNGIAVRFQRDRFVTVCARIERQSIKAEVSYQTIVDFSPVHQYIDYLKNTLPR